MATTVSKFQKEVLNDRKLLKRVRALWDSNSTLKFTERLTLVPFLQALWPSTPIEQYADMLNERIRELKHA